MGAGLILETTFLVDLERELRVGRDGPAQAFLAGHATERVSITFTIAGELAAGHPPEERVRWGEFIAPFAVLPCTDDVCWEYGQAFRYLQANGLLIGTDDLWIAATARAHELPVVTRNLREYGRVPGVRTLGY